MKNLAELSRKIEYEFNGQGLFEQAMTHRSCGHKNNERLEYLGDSILSFVIADDLFVRFPKAKEGELSRLRALMVKGKTLAEIAVELDIGDYLRLGSGELKSGGYRRESILADAVEALIGAVYLDAGMEAARALILRWFDSRLNELNLETSIKDSKTRLQEFLQSRRLDLPEYELVLVEGESHQQMFYINCYVSLLAQPTQGEASSRRQAEQNAAALALQQLKQEKKM